jgi:hypothetical protein
MLQKRKEIKKKNHEKCGGKFTERKCTSKNQNIKGEIRKGRHKT